MENLQTLNWAVDRNVHNFEDRLKIKEAAALLRQNEAIAFPTETVYGLGANALSDEAVGKIFAAKGRPADNPLIVHISSQKQLNDLVSNVGEKEKKLIDAFWPGPLTLLFPKKQGVADSVTAQLSTVGIRMPAHRVARALLEEAGIPIAAPSANRSGKPSPTTAAHVKNDLDGKIAGIVDGGETGVGVESTVVDCSGDVVTILRPGGTTKSDLECVVGEVVLDRALLHTDESPKAPGMKYRHYAPAADLYLVDGSFSFIQEVVNKRRESGVKVGVLTTDECMSDYQANIVLSCGTRADLFTIAHGLYNALRTFDEQNVDEIYSEVFPEEGVGEAIMNRLKKSAGGRIIKE